jgi:hypothetical protein
LVKITTKPIETMSWSSNEINTTIRKNKKKKKKKKKIIK